MAESLRNEENKLSISWKALNYSVTSFGVRKVLLKDIWGAVHPGETLAIMGPSGCGKTTLLNLLADHISTGKKGGQILVNGKPRDKSCRSHISYVCQENKFMEIFSVKETIEFHAVLARPNLTRSERKETVTKVLADMGLVSCQDTRIGTWLLRGISSGQSKRLALALALISNSGIILMDEPTSKVDSSGALHVMKAVKEQAEEKGKTILFSIHQPSSEIFALFDKLLLLSQGRTAYYGPAAEASKLFEAQGHKFLRFSNPADHMLLLLNSDFKGEEAVNDILDYYETSQSRQSLIDSVENMKPNEDYVIGKTEKASFLKQTWLQSWRLLQYHIRNPQQFPSLFYILMCLTVVYSWLLLDYENKSAIPIPILMSILFFLSINCVNMLMVACMQHPEAVLPTFVRERSGGLADCLPFCLGLALVHFPFEIGSALIIGLLEYLLLDINNWLWFGAFYAALFVVFGSIFRNIYLITSNQTTMICLFLMVSFIQMFTCGFVLSTSQMKFPFKQLHEVSVYKYVFSAISYTELKDEEDTTDRNATAYLEAYDIADEDPYLDLYVMGAFVLTFQITYYLLLKVLHNGKK